MTRRTYIVLTFILVIVIGTMPLLDGILFKKKFLHVVDVINQDGRAKVEVLSYHSGWLTASAKLRVTLTSKNISALERLKLAPLNVLPSISFILDGKIYHGPIIYHNKLLQTGYAKIHSKVFFEDDKTERLHIDALAGFEGEWTGRFYAPMVSLSLPTFKKIAIDSIQGNFSMVINNSVIEHIATHIETSNIIIEGDNNNKLIKQISIQPIKINYDAAHETNGLWSGTSSAYTPQLDLIKSDETNFVIEKFSIVNTFSVGENIFYNNNLAINMRHITSPTYTIPAFSKLHIRLSAINFSVTGLLAYINFIKSKSPQELQNIDLSILEKLLSHTITETSKIEGFINTDTSLGTFSCHSKTTWPSETPLPKSLKDVITHSYTKIHATFSNDLIVKLLTIYGDEITAKSDAKVGELKKKTQSLENTYFQNQRPSNDTEFKQTVHELLKQDKISIPLSLQILSLEQQNQPLEMFSLNLDQLNIPPEISDELKAIYQSQIEEVRSSFIGSKTQQLISDLISIGYLQKDNDGYSSKLTVENGILMIGGGPLFPEQATTPAKENQQP